MPFGRRNNQPKPEFIEFNIGKREYMEGIQADNYVRTTRYTFLTFLPLTLYENFQRLANVYFLIIALFSLAPWSPVTPIVSISPLIFVIAVSMLKALFEDLLRYRTDKLYNSIKFEVWRKGRFMLVQSRNIHPGDIIRLEGNRENPADFCIIETSENNHSCFVNEVNLNGETAVKQRKAIQCVSNFEIPSTIQSFENSRVKISSPCNDLRSLNGTITYQGSENAFSMKNVVLKGTFLAHTAWAIGVVLYTGHDTRIIQNQRHPPHKTSRLESKFNIIILIDFIFNFILIGICTFMAARMDITNKFHWIETMKVNALNVMKNFSAFAIIFSYMIPISLYVTVEFVRFFQRWTFSTDLGMYYPGLGFCQPNNSNLNEELGSVDHIFSDKTGTLTENIMRFVQLSARGSIYDVVTDKERVKMLVSKKTERNLLEILAAIPVCSTVICTEDGYSSESPDEEALVNYAKELTATLTARVPDESMTIDLGGTETKFEHLATIEFDSDRKRMSVVVRAPNGEVVIYTKGADTIMFPLIAKDEDESVIKSTKEQVDAFAEQGLRTLIYAWRLMPKDEFEQFMAEYREANLAMTDRDKKVKEVGAKIEKDLVLLGAVAIEDQLQPNVPETMSYLSMMGIKLWVLTGDKHETAVSIAKSTDVITPECKVFEILTGDPSETATISRQIDECTSPCVLVLSPDALIYITEQVPLELVKMGDQCRSVVCFRMSPFLKSKVVDVMRSNTKKVCLAIGDGANDVNMIQTANVGVGIIGREGRQAAQNSDFAITRFKHLKRLLAVHGRLSLVRISGVVRYMVYKNLVFSLVNIPFFYFTRWTPSPIFDGWLMATYNLMWTIFPPGEYGFFEQDVSFQSMMKYPLIYRDARSGRFISMWRFVGELVNAIYQSMILFFFNMYVPSMKPLNGRGLVDDLNFNGVLLYISIILVVDIQAIIRSQHWNIFLFLGVIVSILIFFLVNLPYGSFPTFVPLMYFVPQTIFTSYISYVLLVISVSFSLFPEAMIKYLKGMWAPSYTRVIREHELLEQMNRKKSN
ncbi:phospholipid-translocating P-type ATPase, flippase family protein [Trichomonas vaginalis G3]|uniref:Phospholipid-transporting ATPase n=1 Tax=Trichomonas vaginalis (strain ATCC PRA-98 / G3) TaxID=412133 RepID=A2EL53_TRIV3|nr:putative phospholipid-transporting ATPase family [Trichomonas vaginalis G3]EAY06606.1 phospholipid-translocating P-type ATPase, flippase family protein [Trichomonas vaginalis G3]KAI5551648.1 putative phospholipid-transporting ATPase family [Trichomonas vaginalis G3]|eukprot:XP_001318829.1 phospholipid-translocating P-type ATPase, flippase family protein [Trichomonas vaginalis G3]